MNRNRLLIMSANEADREIFKKIFAADNYIIMETPDRKTGLSLLRHYRDSVCAVLLDVSLTDAASCETLSRIWAEYYSDMIPIFVITEDDDVDKIARYFDLGATEILLKPFSEPIVQRRLYASMKIHMIKNSLQDKVNEQKRLLSEKNKQLMRSANTVLDALSAAIEFRDVRSGEHVSRMKNVTRIITEIIRSMYPEYGIDDDIIEQVSEAAGVHDIGKIMVPDAILNKPGRLTDEEYEIIKKHSINGCMIISSIPSMAELPNYKYTYEICRWHHERWEGDGYPDKLSGDEIPIWTQAVSLADVYDALVSDRVYRPALPHETAVEMILDGQCGTFNPKLKDCLLRAAPLLQNEYS